MSTSPAPTPAPASAPAPAPAPKAKRTVPVFVPDGYVVRKQRDEPEPETGDEPADAPARPVQSRRGVGTVGLFLALGLVVGYATGFAVARHTEPVSVTVSVSGEPTPTP